MRVKKLLTLLCCFITVLSGAFAVVSCGEGPSGPVHTYAVKSETKATCTLDGEIVYECTSCKEAHTYTEVIKALGHTEVKDEAIAATCLSDGLTEGKHCSVCNEVLVAQETVKALGHTLVIDEAVAPTCSSDGLSEGQHCSVCGTVTLAQEVLKAIPHTEIIDEAKAATCTEDGLTEGKYCSVCGTVTVAQEVIAALGHTLIIDAAKAPTCTQSGLTEGEHCAVCGEVTLAQEAVAATGHTYISIRTVAPTCAEYGYDIMYCINCEDAYRANFTNKLAHTYDKEVVDTAFLKSEATCAAKAVYYKSCECGAVGTETFEYGDLAAHTYNKEVADTAFLKSEATCAAKAVYYKSCECGAVGEETFEYGDLVAHTYNKEVADTAFLKSEATCTAKAVYYKSCECGAVGEETFEYGDLVDHAYGNLVAEAPATCVATGTAAHYYCSDCQTYFDENKTATTLVALTLAIDVDNHDIEQHAAQIPSCDQVGWDAYETCKRDGCTYTTYVEKPAGEHSYAEEVVEAAYLKSAATCTSKAVYYTSCTCGASSEGTASEATFETGSKLEHSYINNICSKCYGINMNAIPSTGTVPVTVHDPSIVVAYVDNDGQVYPTNQAGTSKLYFIVGTQMEMAYSFDMENWVRFLPAFYSEGTTTISTNYYDIFKSAADWSKWYNSTDVHGNLWAADAIYNTNTNKWCIYYSVNGDDWLSSVVLLTSDNMGGPYVFDGFVVFSGMDGHSSGAGNDDYTAVTGETSIPSRYFASGSNWGGTYGSSCIDPNVLYDENGELWCVYGSWSGGIFIIKLDNATGLRDLTHDYGYTDVTYDGTSLLYDPYMGIHIAGGYYVSGEGAYVEYIDGYYYLYVSYGFYSPDGGYNMRVFRSQNITGPYVDPTGDSAVFGSYVMNYGAGNNNSNGVKIMQNYQWSWLNYASTSQGHNSVVVDDDGTPYIIYHTKYADGSIGHNVEVHTLVVNEDGWYLAAPFQKTQYDKIITNASVSDLAGSYGVILHEPVNYANLALNTEKELKLNADGTVSGAYTGTWTLSGQYLTLTLSNGSTYKCTVMEQQMEDIDIVTYTFTGMNANEFCIWGYKYPSDEVVINIVQNMLSMPSTLMGSINFETTSLWGTTISYASSDTSVLANDGTFVAPSSDTTVTLTATFTVGGATQDVNFTITCLSEESIKSEHNYLNTDYIVYASGVEKVGNVLPANSSINANTGLSLSFTVADMTSDWDVIFRTLDSNAYLRLSVLGYKEANIFEAEAVASDAAIATGLENWQLFLCGGSSCRATISFNVDGTISFYRDGALMLTYASNKAIGSYSIATLHSYVISQMATKGLYVGYDLENVIVGYAADFDPDTYVDPGNGSVVIGTIGTDDGDGTYTHGFNVWDLTQNVTGDFTVVYNFNVKAPEASTYYYNWAVKVGDWVLRSDFWSMDAANNFEGDTTVTYGPYYDWAEYAAFYADADVRLEISRIGTTATVNATITSKVAGYGTYTYSATKANFGTSDTTVGLGGEQCLVTVYSVTNGSIGAVTASKVVAANTLINATNGLSVSFVLADAGSEDSWGDLINANGYKITYGNLDPWSVNSHNCFPSLTAHNGAWNAMVVTNPTFFTVNVNTSGISIYKNGSLAIFYAPTDPMNPNDLTVADFINSFLTAVGNSGFTYGNVRYSNSNLIVGTSITETEAIALYQSQLKTLTVNYVGADVNANVQQLFLGQAYSVTTPTVSGKTPDKATVSGTIMGDVTETVTYTVDTYTITINYEYADGSQASDPYVQTYEVNSTYSVTSPTITGFTPDQATVSGTVTGDKEITVVYSDQSFDLVIYIDGYYSETKAVGEGAAIVLPECDTDGYTYVWKNADDSDFTLTNMPAEDVTVYATTTLVTYTVTFKADGVTVGSDTYTVEDKTITEPTCPAKTGYKAVWEDYTLTFGDLVVNADYMTNSLGLDNGDGTYTLAYSYNYYPKTLTDSNTVEYNFHIKSGVESNWYNWMVKVDNWILRADRYSLDVTNDDVVYADGVTDNVCANWTDFANIYKDAYVNITVTKTGNSATVAVTIKSNVAGYTDKTYNYGATMTISSSGDVTVSLGGENCQINMFEESYTMVGFNTFRNANSFAAATDFELNYNFDVQSSMAEVWDNWVVQIGGMCIRSDLYYWGNTGTVAVNANGVVFADVYGNANVDLTIKRTGSDYALTIVITPVGGTAVTNTVTVTGEGNGAVVIVLCGEDFTITMNSVHVN